MLEYPFYFWYSLNELNEKPAYNIKRNEHNKNKINKKLYNFIEMQSNSGEQIGLNLQMENHYSIIRIMRASIDSTYEIEKN